MQIKIGIKLTQKFTSSLQNTDGTIKKSGGVRQCD